MLRAKFFLARSNFFPKCQSDSFIIITKAFWKSNQSKTTLILVSQIVFDWCKENLLKHNDHKFIVSDTNQLTNWTFLHCTGIEFLFDWIQRLWLNIIDWLINEWITHRHRYKSCNPWYLTTPSSSSSLSSLSFEAW
mgnify:CR=1 FL=1